MNSTAHDLIIIGGGPAGLTAGLYAARSRISTLLLEKMGCGGQSVITDWIENYPGFPEGISGFELAAKIEEQARKFDLQVRLEEVQSLKADGLFTVTTPEASYTAKAVIIAAGAAHRALDVPGEFELRGHGVSYCATCDGPFFREKDVVVVGGGNSAIQEALYLTRFCRSVTIVHRRDALRATRILQDRALAHPKIKILWNTVIERINGKEKVESISVRDVKTGTASEVATGGVFVFVGLVPNSEIVKGLVAMDEAGYIITDDEMQTSVRGIFACGDVRHKLLRQVVTAVGEGATAAFAAQEYIEGLLGAGQ